MDSSTDTSAAELREYAYSVSHDLGAPVRAMVEFSKLLASENTQQLNPEGREYLGLIVDNGLKMQKMMDGLLQYSRLNTMAKPFTPVDTGAVLEHCLAAMEDLITKTQSRIDTITPLPVISADHAQIIQVFTALLDNAMKFQWRDSTPKIIISAQPHGDHWHFMIADNGIGIHPKYQDKVFKIFSRLHTDDEYEGVGMGLTLAQKIIHRHGGKIWYEPAAERGTIFNFILPSLQADTNLTKR